MCAHHMHVASFVHQVKNLRVYPKLVDCREYRDARKIPLNVEHRMMLGMAPDYDHLMVIQKVEVFQHALDSTSGQYQRTTSFGPALTASRRSSLQL